MATLSSARYFHYVYDAWALFCDERRLSLHGDKSGRGGNRE